MSPTELARQALGADGTFKLHLARRGTTIQVSPGHSVLQALQAAGVEIPYACSEGICGTCLTPVLAGAPEHWDSYQTPEEQAANTHMTPCCSRSLTACLVLDL
ncbi:MAG: Phenoxybenzoate dioxygenase subunit beta [Pseudomonadota bacterium]|jgi:vanillate O-demethylase ferredoxin subunit